MLEGNGYLEEHKDEENALLTTLCNRVLGCRGSDVGFASVLKEAEQVSVWNRKEFAKLFDVMISSVLSADAMLTLARVVIANSSSCDDVIGRCNSLSADFVTLAVEQVGACGFRCIKSPKQLAKLVVKLRATEIKDMDLVRLIAALTQNLLDFANC